MPRFSHISKQRLLTCHEDIQTIMWRVISRFDCTIIQGWRSDEDQQAAFDAGHSKAKPGQSPHNYDPSYAVDVGPYDVTSRNIDWHDRERLHYFAGYVMQTANILHDAGVIRHTLVWGGDWDNDTEVSDNKFDDLVHFEIANWRQLAATNLSRNN